MKIYGLFYTLVIFLLIAGSTQAAVTAVPPVNDDNGYEYYMDEERKVMYIDFESLKVNIQYIVVKNKEGKMILKEDVSKLPVNSIYELNYTRLGEGDYTVEVHTRSSVLSRELHFE